MYMHGTLKCFFVHYYWETNRNYHIHLLNTICTFRFLMWCCVWVRFYFENTCLLVVINNYFKLRKMESGLRGSSMTNFRTQNSTPNQSPYSYFDEERSQYHEFPPGFSYSQSLISQKLDQMVTMLREQKEETNELRKEVSTLNSEVTSVKQDLQHQLSSGSSSSSSCVRKKIPSELSEFRIIFSLVICVYIIKL